MRASATPLERRGRWFHQARLLAGQQSNAAGLLLIDLYLGRVGVSLPPVTAVAARGNEGDELADSLRIAEACLDAHLEIRLTRADPWSQTGLERIADVSDPLHAAAEATRSALASARGVLRAGCRDPAVITTAADALAARVTEIGAADAELLDDPSSLDDLGPAFLALATALRQGSPAEAEARLRDTFQRLSAAAASRPPPPPRRFTSLAELDQAAKRVEEAWGLRASYIHEVDPEWRGVRLEGETPLRPPRWELDCPELHALAEAIEDRYPHPGRIRYFLAELSLQRWWLGYGPHLCCSAWGDDLTELVARAQAELDALPDDWEPPDPDEIGRHTLS